MKNSSTVATTASTSKRSSCSNSVVIAPSTSSSSIFSKQQQSSHIQLSSRSLKPDPFSVQDLSHISPDKLHKVKQKLLEGQVPRANLDLFQQQQQLQQLQQASNSNNTTTVFQPFQQADQEISDHVFKEEMLDSTGIRDIPLLQPAQSLPAGNALSNQFSHSNNHSCYSNTSHNASKGVLGAGLKYRSHSSSKTTREASSSSNNNNSNNNNNNNINFGRSSINSNNHDNLFVQICNSGIQQAPNSNNNTTTTTNNNVQESLNNKGPFLGNFPHPGNEGLSPIQSTTSLSGKNTSFSGASRSATSFVIDSQQQQQQQQHQSSQQSVSLHYNLTGATATSNQQILHSESACNLSSIMSSNGTTTGSTAAGVVGRHQSLQQSSQQQQQHLIEQIYKCVQLSSYKDAIKLIDSHNVEQQEFFGFRDQRNNDNSILHTCALRQDSNYFLKYLDKTFYQVDFNLPNANGATPLMLSSMKGNYDVCRFLVSHRSVDINTQESQSGNSAIHFACMYGQRKIVEMLLGLRQVQSMLRNNEGKSPKDLTTDSKITQLFNKFRKVNLDQSYTSGSTLPTTSTTSAAMNVTLSNISITREALTKESPRNLSRSRQNPLLHSNSLSYSSHNQPNTGGNSSITSGSSQFGIAAAATSSSTTTTANMTMRSHSNSSHSTSLQSMHYNFASRLNKSTTKNTYLSLKQALNSQPSSQQQQQSAAVTGAASAATTSTNPTNHSNPNSNKNSTLNSPVMKRHQSPNAFSNQSSKSKPTHASSSAVTVAGAAAATTGFSSASSSSQHYSNTSNSTVYVSNFNVEKSNSNADQYTTVKQLSFTTLNDSLINSNNNNNINNNNSTTSNSNNNNNNNFMIKHNSTHQLILNNSMSLNFFDKNFSNLSTQLTTINHASSSGNNNNNNNTQISQLLHQNQHLSKQNSSCNPPPTNGNNQEQIQSTNTVATALPSTSQSQVITGNPKQNSISSSSNNSASGIFGQSKSMNNFLQSNSQSLNCIANQISARNSQPECLLIPPASSNEGSASGSQNSINNSNSTESNNNNNTNTINTTQLQERQGESPLRLNTITNDRFFGNNSDSLSSPLKQICESAAALTHSTTQSIPEKLNSPLKLVLVSQNQNAGGASASTQNPTQASNMIRQNAILTTSISSSSAIPMSAAKRTYYNLPSQQSIINQSQQISQQQQQQQMNTVSSIFDSKQRSRSSNQTNKQRILVNSVTGANLQNSIMGSGMIPTPASQTVNSTQSQQTLSTMKVPLNGSQKLISAEKNVVSGGTQTTAVGSVDSNSLSQENQLPNNQHSQLQQQFQSQQQQHHQLFAFNSTNNNNNSSTNFAAALSVSTTGLPKNQASSNSASNIIHAQTVGSTAALAPTNKPLFFGSSIPNNTIGVTAPASTAATAKHKAAPMSVSASQSVYSSPSMHPTQLGHFDQLFFAQNQNNNNNNNNSSISNISGQASSLNKYLKKQNSLQPATTTTSEPFIQTIKQGPIQGLESSGGPNLVEQVPAHLQQGLEKYQVISHLGSGNYGDVYLVQHIRSQKKYAMKLLEKEKLVVKNMMKYAIAERNVMQKCNSPFIVKMYHSFQTETHLVIVMDYCPGGDLYTYLLQRKKFEESLAMKYLSEILLAMEELHFHDVIYRDMKPENIVLCRDGHLKLIDFGLSRENMGEGVAQSFCGSAVYLAPEIISKKGHNKSVDWYQFGVLAYELMVGQPPFNQLNRKELYFHIQNKKVEYPPYLSAKARSLISALLNKNPEERLGSGRGDAQQIKDHPFFESVNWFDVQQKVFDMPIPQIAAKPQEEGKIDLKLAKSTLKELIQVPHWYFIQSEEFA